MKNANKCPWSILYGIDGAVFSIGPFDTQSEALKAATNAQDQSEIDINDTYVYLIGPNHEMTLLYAEDLILTKEI